MPNYATRPKEGIEPGGDSSERDLEFAPVPRNWIVADYQGPLMVPVAERPVKAFRAIRAAHDEDAGEIVVRYIEMDWARDVVERHFDAIVADEGTVIPDPREWQCGFLEDVDELEAAGCLVDATDADREAHARVQSIINALTRRGGA